MSMSGQEFRVELLGLMERAIQPGIIPIHDFILELDKAHHNCLHIAATIEAQAMAKGIVAAGSIPPNFKMPRPPGQ